MLADSLLTAAQFAHARWRLDFRDRTRLEAWQRQQLRRFFREVLPRAPCYQSLRPGTLADVPLMDKAVMMAEFQQRNTLGISLEQALAVACQAEASRDFSPMLGEVTVGLSSGTSGNRGVFLVSRQERLRWAGILLARALPTALFRHLLQPWRPPLRIAFFLRANSNLYTTLHSRRIDFAFHDLLLGADAALPALNRSQPDVLVGPPSLLRALAAAAMDGRLSIRPRHVISVADVLEDRDRDAVRQAFDRAPHQLYQATEGFLAYSCEHGSLHLNESFVHVEPQWLDAERTRFQPVITDFTRHTQLIVRYRLNDILRRADQPCPCGRAELTLAAIEGRADEVLWLPARQGGLAVGIYPDQLRRVMLLAGPQVQEFSVAQSGMQLIIALQTAGERQQAIARIGAELDRLWHNMKVQPPQPIYTEWQPPSSGDKRRRVRLLQPPEGLACMF